MERRGCAGQERSRSPRLRVPADRGRDHAGGVGRGQYLGQAGRARSPEPADARAAREGQRLRPQEYPAEGLPRRPHGRRAGLARAPGHGRPGDGGLSRPRAPGAREPAPVHRDPAPRLPARDGGDPHPRVRGVSLTNNDRSREVLRDVYGEDVIPLSYRRPGFRISREVAQTFEAHPKARALLLEKHGTICWGATVKEAYLATIELISRAEEAIAHRARGRARFGGVALASPPAEERRRVALAVAPRLRGLVGRDRRQVLFFDDAPDVLEFAGSREAEALCRIGPATPDHTIFTKRLPCFAPVENPADPESVRAGVTKAVERFVADYTAYFEAHNTGGARLTDAFPRVVVVGGLGLFATGKDRRTAGIVNDIYHHTISVLGAATSFGGYVSLSARDAFDVEYWPLELYKLSLAPPEKELARRIALVTGGASGIGRAAAQRLAAEGAHVVVADLDAAGARKAAEEIVGAVGAGRAVGLGMDVTGEASV